MTTPQLTEAFEHFFGPNPFVSPELADTLLNELPSDMDDGAVELWEKLERDFNGVVDFLSKTSTGDVKLHSSVYARSRYPQLRDLHRKHPQHLRFILLVAECHYHLQDTHGALHLLKDARNLSEQRGVNDERLNHAIACAAVLAEYEANGDEDDDDDDGAAGEKWKIFTYSRPPDWESSSVSSSLVELRLKWAKLQEQSDGAEQFARLACVTTNEFEGVFNLKGDFSMNLARCGIFASSIDGMISSTSRKKNPKRIIDIIKSTQECYERLQSLLDGSATFGEAFTLALHLHLLDNDNIETMPDEFIFTMVPPGRFREVPCSASHPSEGYETQFCPPRQLAEELHWYFVQVQHVLSSKDVEPYRACAWIQYAFLRIHLFGDGNGRISRMVSSIPLLKEGLPPVIVTVQSKKEYFRILRVADQTGDIDDLASFLQAESFRSITDLINYVPRDSPSKIVLAKSPRQRLEQERRRSKENNSSPRES